MAFFGIDRIEENPEQSKSPERNSIVNSIDIFTGTNDPEASQLVLE